MNHRPPNLLPFRGPASVAGGLVCGALLFAAVLPAGGYAQNNSSRQIFESVGVSPPLGSKLPLDLEFVDADGRSVRLADSFSDRPVIVHLVYYECPMLCKLSSDGLLRALKALSLEAGQDFSIVTVSFDPREGPELSARARRLAIDRCGREAVENGWQFLTGEETSIARLCNSLGFRYAYDAKTRQYAHASGVFIAMADGTLSRYLSGVEFSPRDLRLALVEASAGKIGTAADQVMLMCYMYDPTTGRYGFAIMTALRAGGIATVGGLVLGIVLMIRRERRVTNRAPIGNVGGVSDADRGLQLMSEIGVGDASHKQR
jgi:protein SCO1